MCPWRSCDYHGHGPLIPRPRAVKALRPRVAVNVALGRYPGAGFARVGPDRLELARRIEHKKAQLAVVCGLQMVPLASAEIDHIARLYRQSLTVRPSFAATAQDVHEGSGTLMMIAR